ncbi:hypothetical protein BC352_19575 [Vibrio cholerae]|nr:hypothetical protein BC352_19575 [Vibrio cholerae]
MLPAVAPGRYPEVLRYILDMAESFVLPERRERTYPRAVKKRPNRYATRPSRETANKSCNLGIERGFERLA